LLGTGYESFWLGSRLDVIWKAFGPINESHNGYIEVYLNLGLVGVSLILGILMTSYRRICKDLRPLVSVASLHLALWTVVLFYNMTEAAFRGGLLWLTLLLGAIAIPERTARQFSGASTLATTDAFRLARLPLDREKTNELSPR